MFRARIRDNLKQAKRGTAGTQALPWLVRTGGSLTPAVM